MKYLKVYIKYNWKIFVTHKLDFELNIISIIFNQGIAILFLYIIFEKLPNLKGWNIEQLILIYGLYLINKGSADFFSSGIFDLEKYIQTGSLDAMIVKPVPVILQVICSKFDFFQLVNIFTGWCCLIYWFMINPILFNGKNILLIVMYQLISIIVILALKVSIMSIAFWTQTSYPVAYSIDNLSTFAQYPINIYGKGIESIFIFIFPYAFLSYFPALLILNLNHGPTIIFVSIIIPILLIWIAKIIWKSGLKNYESSGH